MADISSMYYELSIGGKKLDSRRMALIEEVTVEDNLTGSDLLVITVNDPDFEFIEDDIFVEERTVTFKGGWSDDRSVEFEGYISVIDIDFPDTGSPRLFIHCMDNSHLMNRKKKKRTWNKKKASDVAKAIFAEYGFKIDVDDTGKVEETISQSNMTDIQFLIDLAKKQKDDFIVYVEKDKGYFKKLNLLKTPQDTLYYRQKSFDIKNFNPRINKETIQEEVSDANVNDATKNVEKATVANDANRDVQGTPIKSSSSKTSGGTSYEYKGGGQWVKK